MMNYESMTGKSITEINTIGDSIKLFFCAFVAGGNNLDFEGFLDLVDEDFDSVASFTTLLARSEKKQTLH